ncbi:hypothetical protein ARMGADRAFT_1171982 [Armillaria gallica]|uniref:Uncharacterized protein n=1 Tax=Armillaria gallica TaxID=47427 RepID=A0A2H3CP84_ARMGA|nr:hypothetical protein ARMGADRAFT_1171982 [Armillaria gallica]
MPNSDSDSCASSTTSTSDSLSRPSSNTSASSAASQEHPIAVEWAKWEDRLYENVPPMPDNLFDCSVDEATCEGRQDAYRAKTAAARKDVLQEYKKWWADNHEEISKLINSREPNEGPDC